MSEVVRRSKLNWFGHLERKCRIGWVTNCRDLVVVGVGDRGRGRGRKTWNECVEDDMVRLGLKKEDAHTRNKWWNSIRGVPSDPRKRGKPTLNEDYDGDTFVYNTVQHRYNMRRTQNCV